MIRIPTEDEPVEIIHGDCLDVLRALPDGCVDAVITDPPYNVGFEYEGDDSNDQKADYRGWCVAWFAELERVCSGPILISCGIANIGIWHTIKQPEWVMCWHKPAAMGRSPVGFNNWEPVLVYGELPQKIVDVFQAVIRPDRRLDGHPCPKPLMWARKQIQAVPNAALVLDPFGGSGTTAVAAIAEGRRCIVIEKEAAYVQIIRRRVDEALCRQPGSLFAAIPPEKP